eukprot:15329284-Ditylum_brightwellii.AAC.1
MIDSNSNNYFTGKSYKELNYDDDYFVDQECKDRVCYGFTAVVVFTIKLSFVLFMGGPVMILNIGKQMAYQIFCMGRKIIKFIPRIRRKRKKLKWLAKQIKRMLVTTKGTVLFTPASAAFFFTMFVMAVCSLALTMFRRDVYIERNKDGTAMITQNC